MKSYFKILYRKFVSDRIKRNWHKSLTGAILDYRNIGYWKSKCKGNTFFVLGTGSSINTLSEKDWGNIKENTSIGLNFWMIHDFVPDIYLGEIPGEDRGKLWTDVVNERISEYEKAGVWLNIKVPYVRNELTNQKLNNLKLFSPDVLKQINLVSSFPIYTADKFDVIQNTINYINKCKKNNDISHLAQIRGSVIGAYLLGAILGFQKIVFCGVDLNDTRYFYTEKEEYYKMKNRTVPPTGYAPGAIHGNVKPVSNTLDVIEIVQILDEYFKKHYGVKTYNINPSSRLNEILPLYES